MKEIDFNLELEKYLFLERIEKLTKDRNEIITEYMNTRPCENDFKLGDNKHSIDIKKHIECLEKSYMDLEKAFVKVILEESKFLDFILK